MQFRRDLSGRIPACTGMARVGAVMAVAGLTALATATVPAAETETDGAMHVTSRHNVEDTVERARRMIERQGLRVFGIIDHQDAAKKVGETLLPTRLLVFGNPKLGTNMMRDNRILALDLPMKLLVWEDAQGVVWITYYRAGELAARHGFSPGDKRVARMDDALRTLAKAAAR